MTLTRPRVAATLAAATAALLAAGCGASHDGHVTTAAGGGAMPMAGHAATTHATTTHAMAGGSMPGASHMGSGGAHMGGMTPLVPGADGTSAAAAGLRLEPATRAFRAGRTSTFAFTVTGMDGRPVTRFERDQTKLLHLIVVRDDLTGYQHLHPALGAGGRFTVPLDLGRPGRYRAIADFTTGGKRYALGTNLVAPGDATAAPLPSPSATGTADGYAVRLRAGRIVAGREATLTFAVTRGGAPVAGLQPYLGAYGHLVALRRPDVAYSHVHPTAEDRDAGTITFAADFPTRASYRLFLQFRAAGRVHTVPFTVRVE
jgi:hypothetical protein